MISGSSFASGGKVCHGTEGVYTWCGLLSGAPPPVLKLPSLRDLVFPRTFAFEVSVNTVYLYEMVSNEDMLNWFWTDPFLYLLFCGVSFPTKGTNSP